MERLRVLRSRWWYAVAVAIVVVGWLGGVIWQASQWNELRRSDVAVVGQKLQARGSAVAVFTDLQQSGRTIVCTASGPGRARTAVPAAPLSLDVVSGGTTWHLLGLMRSGRDQMTVSCAPRDRKTDTATYGTAVVDRIGGRPGAAIAWTAIVLSVVLAAATAVTRRLVP